MYLGGDRITAGPFTGTVRRGDAALALGSQFVTIVDGNAANTAPHADSRSLVFDANGNLLESDDGGIYRRSSPTSASGAWGSVIGNLSVFEVHDLAYDRNANVMIIGVQDNGTHMQTAFATTRWTSINGGDGGDVAIDDTSLLAAGSQRYLSSQNLGGFARRQYSAANTLVTSFTMPNIANPQFVTPIELGIGNPGRMLVGGLNAVYESTNVNSAAPTLVSLGTGTNRNAIAYGSVPDPAAAYTGKGAAVFRRSGAAFVATAALPAGANTITDVAMDPDDPARVYAVDDNQIFFSNNSGTSWTDITGNIGSISSFDFRTIEYIPEAGGDLVVVGTRSGVYSTLADQQIWTLFGAGLPNVLVFDMRYIPSTRTLIVGTLGRGVWTNALPIDGFFANGFE